VRPPAAARGLLIDAGVSGGELEAGERAARTEFRERCRPAASGTTPAILAASRSTTASGPPPGTPRGPKLCAERIDTVLCLCVLIDLPAGCRRAWRHESSSRSGIVLLRRRSLTVGNRVWLTVHASRCCWRAPGSAGWPEASLTVVAFGELLEVQQLPPGHDQVAGRQRRDGPAPGPRDDLQQQARRAVILGYQDVGHEGAHDGAR
jgi:hypothetical protein